MSGLYQQPNKTEKFADDDLRRLLSYTQDQDKTEHQLYVTGFHCDPETACMSMELTKRLWEQPTDKGVLAYHIIQSFSPGEATPDKYTRLAVNLHSGFLRIGLSVRSAPIWTKATCTII